MDYQYYLCSEAVIEHFVDLEKSKPFRAGWVSELDTYYYIIHTNRYGEIEEYFNSVIEPFNDKSRITNIDFWLNQCVPGNLTLPDVIDLQEFRKYGLLRGIEDLTGLTQTHNQAIIIYELSEYAELNPIEFVNTYADINFIPK